MDDDRLVKTVMLGMVDGDRTRGRPPRRWVDDITDWCGCTLPAAVHLTVNRIHVEWNKKIDDVVADVVVVVVDGTHARATVRREYALPAQ